MDVWRYSDWAGWGKQVRDSQPHIWHWRDWIVESLNRDQPYDRMVVAMLAADEASPDDLESLRATGYLARNFKLLSREKWMQDVVDHTGAGLPGRDARLRPLPRPHVRPDPPERVLPGACDLRAAPGPDRPRSRNARHGQGWHPPRLRRAARRQDAPVRPWRRPQPDGQPSAARRAGVSSASHFPRSSRWRSPAPPIAPDRRAFVIRDQIDALEAEVAKAADAAREGSSASRTDAEVIELAQARARCGRELSSSPGCRRAGGGARRAGQGRASKEWIEAAERASQRRSAHLAVAVARRGELVARQGAASRATGQRAEADKAHADAVKAACSAPGKPPVSPPSTSYTAPARDDLSRRQHGAPAGLRSLDHRPIQPPDGPRGRQSSLGPPLRPGDRAVGQRLRPQRPAAVAPGPARLARGRVHGTRLEHEGDPPPDRHQRHLPPGFEARRGGPRPRPGQRLPLAVDAPPRRGRGRPRLPVRRCRQPRLDHGRPRHRPSGRPDRPAAQPLLPARRREADGVPPDLRRRGRDRVLPPQGEHPAPAGPGAGQQRSVAAPGPPAGPDALDRKPAPIPASFVTAAFEQVLTRGPTELERVECLGFLGEEAEWTSASIAGPDPQADSEGKTPAADPAFGAAKAWSTCS